VLGGCAGSIFPDSLVIVQPRTHRGPVSAAKYSAYPGEIGETVLKCSQNGPKSVSADLGIDPQADIIVAQEQRRTMALTMVLAWTDPAAPPSSVTSPPSRVTSRGLSRLARYVRM